METTEPTNRSREARARLTQRLFSQGVPRLWCPTLTHFAAKGQLDDPHIRRHWQQLVPYVKGALVPGSTGEGWEMTEGDIQDLLAIVLEVARATGIRVLIGVLKTDLPGGRSAAFVPYVRHKIRTECELLDEHALRGFPVVILRPGDVLGPYDRVRSARLLAGCERGLPLIVGHGRWRFAYCYVGNLCQAAELALVGEGIEGRSYTVTNGGLPTWRDLFEAFQRGVGKRQRIYMPVIAARLAAAVSGLARALLPRFEPTVNRYRVRRVTSETTYDISRTIAELGYRPDDDYVRQFAEVVAWYIKEQCRDRRD